MFVNPAKLYASYADIMIGLTKKHLSNKELAEDPELFAYLYQTALKLVREQYGGDARVMLNEGDKFASVPEHGHIQVLQSRTTRLYIPAIKRVYK